VIDREHLFECCGPSCQAEPMQLMERQVLPHYRPAVVA